MKTPAITATCRTAVRVAPGWYRECLSRSANPVSMVSRYRITPATRTNVPACQNCSAQVRQARCGPPTAEMTSNAAANT
jgi:hypothetical protein